MSFENPYSEEEAQRLLRNVKQKNGLVLLTTLDLVHLTSYSTVNLTLSLLSVLCQQGLGKNEMKFKMIIAQFWFFDFRILFFF